MHAGPELGAVVDVLRRAIREAGAHEICGFLVRHPLDGLSFLRTENQAGSPGAFLVSAAEDRRCRLHAAARQLEVVAFLHSHPSDLAPSRQDMASFAQSDLPWVIVRLREGAIEARWLEKQGVCVPAASV